MQYRPAVIYPLDTLKAEQEDLFAKGKITPDDRALIQVLLNEAILNKSFREKISEDEAEEAIMKSTNLISKTLRRI